MWLIYKKPTCVWCDRAAMLLKSKGIEFETINVMEDAEAQKLFVDNGYKPVPQIFHDGVNIGGYEKLVEYLK